MSGRDKSTAPEPRKAWVCGITKASTGARVIFSLHDTEVDAANVAKRLREFGLDAWTSKAEGAGVTPGSTLHLPSRIKVATR